MEALRAPEAGRERNLAEIAAELARLLESGVSTAEEWWTLDRWSPLTADRQPQFHLQVHNGRGAGAWSASYMLDPGTVMAAREPLELLAVTVETLYRMLRERRKS